MGRDIATEAVAADELAALSAIEASAARRSESGDPTPDQSSLGPETPEASKQKLRLAGVFAFFAVYVMDEGRTWHGGESHVGSWQLAAAVALF